MHSRNLYRDALDFEALACSYPPLANFVHGHHFDFQDDAGQRCLTQALLKRDFNLELDLPADRLCPPVPNRLNYVLWIQDIVWHMQQIVPLVLRKDHVAVVGLDIGTGASSIYPLLACALESEWSFVATELDDLSYTYASKNVASNKLSDRIRVVKVLTVMTASNSANFGFGHLFSLCKGCEGDTSGSPKNKNRADIQFTMCNPPFYSCAEEVEQSEALKEHSPSGVCTGAPIEMITPGGEASFVEAMVLESIHTRTQRVNKRRRVDGMVATESPDTAHLSEQTTPQREGPRWYTSMLGKMGSVTKVVDLFKTHGISNYAITEFIQGHTRRWAVGWSVDAWRLSDDIARIVNPNPTIQRLLPPRNVLRFPIPLVEADVIEAVLRGMKVTVSEGASGNRFTASALQDTWSRNARRKRKWEEASAGAVASTPGGLALVCAVVLITKSEVEEMEVQWLYGRDRGLFESFASHVAKRINSP